MTYKSVELDSEDCVGIAVVADLSSLLEMTHFELARRRQTDESNKTAGEQSINKTDIVAL